MGGAIVGAFLAWLVVRKVRMAFWPATGIIAVGAAAGALAGVLRHVHGNGHAAAGVAIVTLGLELGAATAGIFAFWVAVSGRRRRRHGSAAIASTRYVLYVSPATEAAQERKAIRPGRKNSTARSP